METDAELRALRAGEYAIETLESRIRGYQAEAKSLQAKLEQAERVIGVLHGTCAEYEERLRVAEPALAAAKQETANARAANLENSLALAAAQGALREARKSVQAIQRLADSIDYHHPERLNDKAGAAAGKSSGGTMCSIRDFARSADAALAAESGKPGGEAPRVPERMQRDAAIIERFFVEAPPEPATGPDPDYFVSAEPRAAPPALPAELSGKGEQRQDIPKEQP